MIQTTPALQKSAHEIIRVTTHEYQGATMVSARVWYVNKRGEQWPSRRGLTVPPAVWRALLPLIAEELELDVQQRLHDGLHTQHEGVR